MSDGLTQRAIAARYCVSKGVVSNRILELRKKGVLPVFVQRRLRTTKELARAFSTKYGGGTPDQIIRSGRAKMEDWCDWIQTQVEEVIL
jgi:DNA-binding transcriptional regulator LsrR (DeoR family)